MEGDLKALLREQQELTMKINKELINSTNLNLEILKASTSNTIFNSEALENNIARIYALLTDKSKSFSKEQRTNLFDCRMELIALRARLNLLLSKSQDFINKAEKSSQGSISKVEDIRGITKNSHVEMQDISKIDKSSEIISNANEIKKLSEIKDPDKIVVDERKCVIKENINPVIDNRIKNTHNIPRQKREKSAIVKKIEANLGLYFMIAIGTLLCLFGISVFGKYVYVNMLGDAGKGILMYIISGIVLFIGQFILKKVKDIVIVNESVIGLGLGLLYLSTIVNFMVLDNLSYIITHCLLIVISLYALYLSRNSDFDIIRIVGVVGIYIALIPVTAPTLGSSIYILSLGYLFTILNMVVPLKNSKYFEVLNIAAIIIFSILVNIYTSILIVNVLNSLIAVALNLYIYHKSTVKSAELYLFSFAANIIILARVVSDSEILSILIAVVVICYIPLLNDINDMKKQIRYKMVALGISTLLLFGSVESEILLILLLNVIYFFNIYYSILSKNIYEHKFEFISLTLFNFVLILSDSLPLIYLASGLIPSIYTLSRCNYRKDINYIIAFGLEILSFKIFFNGFDIDSVYMIDMLTLVYAVCMAIYNLIIFKDSKTRKINIAIFFLFSIILFKSFIFISIILILLVVILFKRNISSNMTVYITMLSILKLSLIFYFSIGNSYDIGLFMITVFLAFIYIYKYYIDSQDVNILIALVMSFVIVSFVIESPILIVILTIAIQGVFYKRSKSLVDMLIICITTAFVVISSYDNSYMIYVLLITLFIIISLLKWSEVEVFNITYYIVAICITGMALWNSEKWFVFIFIAINILLSHPTLKSLEKYFKIGDYAYLVFSIIGLAIFGFVLKDIYLVYALTIFYIGCIVACSEEDSELISMVLIIAFITLVLNVSVYMIPVFLIVSLNYKKLITSKNIDYIIVVFLALSIVKAAIYKNPVVFILAILITCTSRYIYNISFINENAYKEYKYFKVTELTLICGLSIIVRMFIYIYSFDNLIGIFIYAIISSFVIIVIGFYIKSTWFRKIGLGTAMATCASILIFINGMNTIQKTFISCGVGITCIAIAIVYSKLEKKYIK